MTFTRILFVVSAAAGLTGCPSSWGFSGRVYAMKAASLEVLVVDPATGDPTSDALAPLADAQIVCDGCPDPKITVDAQGHFFVPLGTSYGAPPKIVLHVTAPHRQPMDLVIPHAARDSQIGWQSVVVVMKPER